MQETIYYCPRCENCVIARANQVWCNKTDDCDGVWMVDIGYMKKNKPIYKDIEPPKRVK